VQKGDLDTTKTPAPVILDREEDLVPDSWVRSWSHVYMLRSMALSALAKTGRLPSSLNEILATTDLQIGTDTWGTPIRYTVSDGGFEFRSAGPDRTFGNADDIVAARTSITPQPQAEKP
jgi:hypothetical protein